MKYYLAGLLATVLLVGACGDDAKKSDSKDKSGEKNQPSNEVKASKYTSDDWIVVSFGLGDMGYQTPDSAVMLKGNYTFLRPFSEKHASARITGNKMGIIDEKGKEVIPFKYNYTSSVGNGLFAVKKDTKDKVGYMNLDGKYVVQPKYDMGFAFKGKRARVAVGAYQDMMDFKYMENCKYGFIDEKGNEVIEPQYDWAGDFAEGIAPVAKNGRYFFIDTEGNKVDDKTYARLSGFRGDLCWVVKGNKGGFINRKNEVVIPLEYTNHMFFFNRGSRFGVMNKESEIGETRFQTEDGLFFLAKGEHKWGIVNDKNEVLTPFEYSTLSVPEDGYMEFEKRGKSGFGSYNNGVLKEIVPAEFSYIYHYPGNDYIEVGTGDYSNRKMGMYSTDGKELIPPKYEDVENCENGIYGVKIDGKWALLKGDKQITEPLYDYVSSFDGGRTYATRGDETVYVDSNGKEHKSPR
ncbi:MAG: WG repeat-containing protein [bacterium]|nr:WG repeat-containing protein [bacterium]